MHEKSSIVNLPDPIPSNNSAVNTTEVISTTVATITNESTTVPLQIQEDNQDNCLPQDIAMNIYNDQQKTLINSPFFDGQPLTYNQTLTQLEGKLYQLYQPLLIMGGIISIVWVGFYRTTIVLTEHNNIKSAFFSTLIYVVFPTITLLSLINISEFLIGESSVKCINCRVYQNWTQGIGYDNYTEEYPNTTVVCNQQNSGIVQLVIVSMVLKVLDHIASGWLLLCCLSRGAFKVHHDSNIFQTTYKMGNFRLNWQNRLG